MALLFEKAGQYVLVAGLVCWIQGSDIVIKDGSEQVVEKVKLLAYTSGSPPLRLAFQKTLTYNDVDGFNEASSSGTVEVTMRQRDYYEYQEDPWEGVQLTKEAIRARAALTLYTALLTAPFVALVGYGAFMCGLKPHEVLGISCYNAMISSIFFFDTLRNAAHECFDAAQADGQVTCREGIPIIAPTYPHRRLARLSFAIGGRTARKKS